MNRRLSILFLALLLPQARPAFSRTPTATRTFTFTLTATCSFTPTFTPTSTATPTSTRVPYTYSQLKSNLNEYIRDEVIDHDNIRGLSIALVDGGQVVWVKGFGTANGATHSPATKKTRYALGGVSRLFTAAEILHLAERDRVSLDRPLQKYIPGFSIHSRFGRTKSITVRALLGDHSGLPGFFLKGLWVDHPESLADLVEDLKSDYLYDKPGQHYRYSYVNYSLLGRVVELRRKMPFADAVKMDLFEPLGMESTAFERPVAGGDTAKGYVDGDPVTQSGLRDAPAAGTVSSAEDMAKFLAFLLGPRPKGRAPLREKSLEAMLENQYPDKPLDFGHETGMAWNLDGLKVPGAEETVWCDGTYPGYFAQVTVLKKEKLGLVLLSNSSETGKIADQLTGRFLRLALQVKTGFPADLEKKKIEMPPTVEVPEETLRSYAGVYSALGQVTRITAKEKTLGVDFQGHGLDLVPVSQTTFIPHLTFIIFPIDLPQYPLTFASAGGKDVILLGGLHFPVPFERISPVKIPYAWTAREGEYELENPDGQMDFSRISLEMGEEFLRVVLKVSLPALHIKDQEFKVALLPQSDVDAVVPGLFYGDGGTLHTVEDARGNTWVYYSGYWFKKKTGTEGAQPAFPAATPVLPVHRPTI